MVISSDEDSDSNATENDDDQDDHLPSIAEIVSRLNESERSCSNAAVGSAAVSVAADPPSVESRRSSVVIQPRGSPAAGSHQAELSPETAANARAPTPAPISPVATVPCEDEQPNHGGEMKSCEPRRPSIVYENAHQPASRISQDTALNTTLNTVPGPDHRENDPGQPEPRDELHTDSANDAMIDVANSTPHQAEVTAENGCDDVEVGTPADPTTATVPEDTQSPSTHVPRTRQAKRHRQTGPSHRATAISNEEVHISKRRKVAASIGLGRGTRSDMRRASKPRTHASKQKDRGRTGTAHFDRKQATNHADANYQEWPLPDAVLQRTQVNGQTTLQLQFTWATSCASHVAPNVGLAGQPSVQPSIRRDSGAETSASETQSTSAKSLGSGNPDDESDIYDVTRVLARWKRGIYLLEWADGSTSWEPKRNIVYQQTIDDFEATYQGLNEGIDVLASRTRKGKQQWRVHWHGRPAQEDCWVDGKLMDPRRVGRIQAFGFDKPRE
jgi:hypothetical protein